MGTATERHLPLIETGVEQFRWSGLCLPPRPTFQLPIVDDAAAMRRILREECPTKPGIYGFFDFTGQLIYVGYSSKLLRRLTTYFQQSEQARKEHRISNRATWLMWETVGHPFAAMHRELEIIQQFQPRLNVRGRSRRQKFGYLYQTNDAAPRFALRYQLPGGIRHCWGPLWIDKSIREGIEVLNRAFLLPDCPITTRMVFQDERLLFDQSLHNPCLRAETQSCLAPCGGTCSKEKYFAQLQAARELLDGKSDAVLVALEKRIAEAAEARRYELAARLHDTRQSLEYLQQRLQAVRKPSYQNGVYQIRMQRRRVWFLLSGSVVEASVAEPLSAKRVRRFLELVDQHSSCRVRKSTQRNRLASQIVNLWFRQHPEEMERVMTYDVARRFFENINSARSPNSALTSVRLP